MDINLVNGKGSGTKITWMAFEIFKNQYFLFLNAKR